MAVIGTRAALPPTGDDSERAGGDVLSKAVARQETQLRDAQAAHGEFGAGVSEDLAQLALLYIMRGEAERALPLLHRRLVIHEKFGPEELVGEALQELGTVYRLIGTPEVARQHLTRALELRARCHGEQSLKVAETLNSLTLVQQVQGDAAATEALQLRSLRVLRETAEPEDAEGEDVPWEVFKRLKRQRGPSTAANGVLLYKGSLRKAAADALLAAASDDPSLGDAGQGVRTTGGGPGTVKEGDSASNAATGDLRGLRSKSDGAMRVASDSPEDDRGPKDGSPPRQPIADFAALQQRVEHVKRRVAAGLPDSDGEVAQLATDVARIPSPELRAVGDALLSLVRELVRMRVRSDAARQLPALEGVLEKKSASIFRGWEKRWFKVDPKTFVLSYHFSKDDDARGFAPRGGFAISRVASILVHRHARGSFFHFDVVVDLSTRSNPHGSRTYELRCEDEETLRYWVDTLHYYKTVAQTSPPRPSTG